jgi:hypothetical protein
MPNHSTPAALRLSDQLGPLVARLTACAEDPMWEDHAEVPKVLLRNAANALEETAAIAEHFMAQRDAARNKALHDAARWVDEEVGHAAQDGWSVEAVQALMATRDMLKAHAEMQVTTVEVRA